jgi:hypothetical protein
MTLPQIPFKQIKLMQNRMILFYAQPDKQHNTLLYNKLSRVCVIIGHNNSQQLTFSVPLFKGIVGNFAVKKI